MEKHAEEDGGDPEEEEPELPLAVPEESAPGESQSNGEAEWSIECVEDQARTLKVALEDRIQRQIACSHPIVRRIIEHAGTLLTKYHVDAENNTGYVRLHGHACHERIPEFGKPIMHFIPSKLRRNVGRRWQFGVYLDRSWNSSQNFIGK